MNYVCQQRLKLQRACVCKKKECTFVEIFAGREGNIFHTDQQRLTLKLLDNNKNLIV